MPVVDLSVRGRVYKVTAEAGQEGHVRALARHVEQRLSELAPRGASGTDLDLLLLAALTLAHDAHAAQAALQAADATQAALQAADATQAGVTSVPAEPAADPATPDPDSPDLAEADPMGAEPMAREPVAAAPAAPAPAPESGVDGPRHRREREITLAAIAHVTDRLMAIAEALEQG